MKVLIVEDDADIAANLCDYLDSHGYEAPFLRFMLLVLIAKAGRYILLTAVTLQFI